MSKTFASYRRKEVVVYTVLTVITRTNLNLYSNFMLKIRCHLIELWNEPIRKQFAIADHHCAFSTTAMSDAVDQVECPICGTSVAQNIINKHIDSNCTFTGNILSPNPQVNLLMHVFNCRLCPEVSQDLLGINQRSVELLKDLTAVQIKVQQ